MASSWPPTPSVEDEEAALAREHGLDTIISPFQSDEEPQVKGTVDQYPIILDVNPSRTLPNGVSTSESDREHSSSDESHGPPTPTVANSEQRFVLLDNGSLPKASPEADWQLPRPKPTANLKSDDLSRGRPYISPIHTDVGNDLEEMVTGRRRPPSPYSSGPKQPLSDSQLPKRFSGSSHLSPEHASSDEYQRPRPTGPRAKHEDVKSLTDHEKSSDQRRQHSRRRRDSGIRTEIPSLEKLAPSTIDKRSMSYAAALPAVSILASGLNKQAREDPSLTDSTRAKRASRDSPYSSEAEEKTRRHRSKSRQRSKSRPRVDNTNVRESPYTSSAEESGSNAYRRYKGPATTGKPSRRNSTIKKEWPRLDISDQHYSYGTGDPATDGLDRSSKRRSDPRHHPVFSGRSHLESSSAQSPQVMEDYLAKAFNANSQRSSRTPRGSPNPSPLTSPLRSPPRTPRRNRSSKDYFDLELSAVQDGPKLRQPSGDDSPWNILHPLTNATAAAVADNITSRPVPSLSRSSTAPIETPSHTSSSHGTSSKTPSSGQRSRRPSPVQEEVTGPVSRANSFDVRDDRLLSRVPTSASVEPRRQPRVATIVTEASSGTEHRPSSRVGLAGLEASRPITRAYSTAPDDMHRPPPAYRAMSSGQVPSPVAEQWRPVSGQRTASSTYITPMGATSPSVFPFLPPRSMSFTPVPIQGPPAPIPNREPAPKNLPPCPRSTPVAGYHDWYTVNQVSDINICPTCMGTLGASRFRDIFVPSFSNSGKDILCSMNQPWLRIAFIQAVKQRRTPQEMAKLVYDLLHLPEGTRPCSGKKSETRKWYQLVDPFDGSIVPGFEVCTHCVRNVDLVFPQLKGTFTRTTSLLQERICNLNAQCKRFLGYIEQLDKAASRFDAERSLQRPDVQDLARYARRVANIQDCPRDNMMFSQEWHFMANLPEFTVCPECFEEVVRPVWDKPLANTIPKRPRLLPVSQESRYVPAGATSCQLYSARMRKAFHDAVRNSDFELLKDVATKRHDAEVRCQARHRELMQDTRAGHDRTAETLRNAQVWQSWE